MKFRTEIGNISRSFAISHNDRIVLIGSCFADNIGERLVSAGFNAVHNPMGPLFNPASIAGLVRRGQIPYSAADFINGPDGTLHCLDFANRYQDTDISQLANRVNTDYASLSRAIAEADVLIITFGNDKIYEYNGKVAGNCHKLPASTFTSRYLDIDEICSLWHCAIPTGRRVIFTLSPVRYTGDGLAQSGLSKATLRVAIDKICRDGGYDYFPAYEIFTDELRDYRFYASDMVHPSEVGADYVFERFTSAYLDENEKDLTKQCLALTRRLSHRQLGERNGSTILFEKETDRLTSSLSKLSPRIANAIERIKKEVM